MKLTLKEWMDVQKYEQSDIETLQEKLIMYNNGANYGQIVFLAGGAGSGKGFAIKNFMEKNKFKVRDVDEFKKAVMKMEALQKKYPDLKGLELSKPKDVFRLHMIVKELKIKDKTLDLLLKDLKEDRLPNIIFDITLKEIDDITEVMPLLKKAGYKPNNIHLTWVLTNYRIAVKNNAERERVVPEDILLKTHEGAAKTMYQIVRGSLPSGLNGAVNVILNNPENTIFYDTKTTSGKAVIKDFKYLTLKKAGKSIEAEGKVQDELYKWIKGNIPKSKQTKEIF
jgi:dephospho-CoA kinase